MNILIRKLRFAVVFVLLALGACGGGSSPDPTFGTAGKVDTAFTENASASGVALQPDGEIVVGGQAPHNVGGYGVARINP